MDRYVVQSAHTRPVELFVVVKEGYHPVTGNLPRVDADARCAQLNAGSEHPRHLLDRDEIVEAFRQKLLAALDDGADETFGQGAGGAGLDLGKRGRGSIDADLPALFAALDDQVDRLAERLGDKVVDRYRRVDVKWHPFQGYHGSDGIAVHFGYCERIADFRAEVDDHRAEEAEHYRDLDTPADTPSLDTSFHDGERVS